MNGDYLRSLIMPCLDKDRYSGFETPAVVFDGASTNSKVVRKLLKQKVINPIHKTTSLPELKLEIFFLYKENKYFFYFEFLIS